jgi:beta-lactam-binding protein with PASTA domain
LIDKSNGAIGDKNVIDQNPKPGAYLPPNGTVTVYLDVKR